jgi:hypothetical protein
MRLKVNYLKHHERKDAMEKEVIWKKVPFDKESLAWLTPQVLEALEDSYRRGYFHGASQCHDYHQSKYSIDRVGDWIDDKIQYWLFTEPTSKKILPPTI